MPAPFPSHPSWRVNLSSGGANGKGADFFWHLKTGKWIGEHKTLPLPQEFLFSLTAIALLMRVVLMALLISSLVLRSPRRDAARGDLLSRLQRYDEARAAYQSALRRLPHNQLILDRLADLPAAVPAAPGLPSRLQGS